MTQGMLAMTVCWGRESTPLGHTSHQAFLCILGVPGSPFCSYKDMAPAPHHQDAPVSCLCCSGRKPHTPSPGYWRDADLVASTDAGNNPINNPHMDKRNSGIPTCKPSTAQKQIAQWWKAGNARELFPETWGLY